MQSYFMLHDGDYEFSSVTPEIYRLSKKCLKNNMIDPEFYNKYDVKRGLRDVNGKGVLTGLTEISEVFSFIEKPDGTRIAQDGKLFYRGYDVEDIVKGFTSENRFGFEEVAYLLLFGELPDKANLDDFYKMLDYYRTLPTGFVRDIIMKAPSRDIMNAMSRSVLTMYSYDSNADDTSIPNVLRQCIQLIALFPIFSVYGFQAFQYYHDNQSLIIHTPKPELSTAENILYMLRPDSKYTPLEAKLLDMALVLHAEHGGGNNSTFTCRCVTSTGTDAYAAYASAISALKGPRHGGANIKVMEMLNCIENGVKNWENEGEVADFLTKILNKEENDHSGLIYGMGHAVYTLSDPRAVQLKKSALKLAKGTEVEAEFRLLDTIERLTPQLFAKNKGDVKTMCANVDMYSGLVYKLLGIPVEMYTALFACARMPGWCAHRMEEIENGKRIMRPAYRTLIKNRDYIALDER